MRGERSRTPPATPKRSHGFNPPHQSMMPRHTSESMLSLPLFSRRTLSLPPRPDTTSPSRPSLARLGSLPVDPDPFRLGRGSSPQHQGLTTTGPGLHRP